MAETVNVQCYDYNQQGRVKRECPIREVDQEAKGLYVDQVNEEEKHRV